MTAPKWERMGGDSYRITDEGHVAVVGAYSPEFWLLELRTGRSLWRAGLDAADREAAQLEADRLITEWQARDAA